MRQENRYREDPPVIYLIGIGMGSSDQLTGEAIDCLRRSQAVLGAGRMLEAVREFTEGRQVYASYRPSEMTEWLSSFEWEEAALVLSGDTGFYSGAEAASRAFEEAGWETCYVPGISSLSYFCARLGRSWQNVRAISSHGRDCDLSANVRRFASCFILLGGEGSVQRLCRQLVSDGLGHVTLCVGENFSYEEERIICNGKPSELIMEDEARPFGSLACVLVDNPEAEEGMLYPPESPRDQDFIRGNVPMTKETVRRLSLEKLRIGDGAVCYDIGAGTGSLAVEMGLALRRRCAGGKVYAIEKKEEALELIDSNCRKFHGGWSGFQIVSGEAPEALEGLEPPTHALIGGSGGRLREIIAWLLEANPQVRIVANAISLETVGELLACMREFGFQEAQLVQVMASPVETVGGYHMPKAQNPVYVAVMQNPLQEDVEWQDL